MRFGRPWQIPVPGGWVDPRHPLAPDVLGINVGSPHGATYTAARDYAARRVVGEATGFAHTTPMWFSGSVLGQQYPALLAPRVQFRGTGGGAEANDFSWLRDANGFSWAWTFFVDRNAATLLSGVYYIHSSGSGTSGHAGQFNFDAGNTVSYVVGTGAAANVQTGSIGLDSAGPWTITGRRAPFVNRFRLWNHTTGLLRETVDVSSPCAWTSPTYLALAGHGFDANNHVGTLALRLWRGDRGDEFLAAAALEGPFGSVAYTPRVFVSTAAPGAPTNPAAVAGNEQATVSWTGSAGATSYNLYWSTSSPVTAGDNKIAGVTSPYVHTGRTNGIQYYYAVTAENAVGESSLSAEVSATPTGFALGLEASDPETVGVWRIDRWQIGTPRATIALRDLKAVVKTKLPLEVFTREAYPYADSGIIGEPIPVGFGKLKGCTAYLINTVTKTFKVFGCQVSTFDAFYTDDAEPITPNTIDLINGEFTWSAYDGETLLADATLPDDNPVDVVKLLLTDPTRGASLPLANLDTVSSGKGFGASGARLHHVRGTIPTRADEEVPTYRIGLYVDRPRDVFEWAQDVLVAAFLTLYIDRAGLYQIKAWRPGRREDATVIQEAQVIPGTVRPITVATDPVTRCRVKYSSNPGLGTAQVVLHSDEELRQLRGLSEHAVLERELPLSERFGGQQWAQRAVAMRGVPRRTVTLRVTQEHSQVEPGDYVRLIYPPLGIDAVWEVLAATIRPGSAIVDLTLIDSRGFGDGAGWWTSTAGTFNFPADLGGSAISAWSAGWTSAQKQWYRENWGVWTSTNGYANASADPYWSYRGSRWT